MGYEIIKKLAKEKGVSLDCIAQHAGITYNSLSKIIRNTIRTPKYSTLEKIAESLGMRIDELAYAMGMTNIPPDLLKAPFNITKEEEKLVKDYRMLDAQARNVIKIVLDNEIKRIGLKDSKKSLY